MKKDPDEKIESEIKMSEPGMEQNGAEADAQENESEKKEPLSTRAGEAVKGRAAKITGFFVKKYNAFQKKRRILRRRSQIAKEKLNAEDYRVFVLNEFLHEGWKIPGAVILSVAIVAACLGGVSGLAVVGSKAIAKAIEERKQKQIEEEAEEEPLFPEVDLTIGSTGCMLLHSPFLDAYKVDEENHYDYSEVYRFIKPYYSAPDFMTCEFEGSLGGLEYNDYSGYPLFNSPDEIIENIRDAGVDLQFLATNHIYDSFSPGFNRTMDQYEKNNIAYTGIRKDVSTKRYYIVTLNGLKIGFLNYVYEAPMDEPNLNTIPLSVDDFLHVNRFSELRLDEFYGEMGRNLSDMRNAGVQFIIVQMHWGNEYELVESKTQDKIAQKLCDMGVDAIIGGHPHCEQPVEVFTASDGSGRKMFCAFSEGNALSNQRQELLEEMSSGHTEDGVIVTLTLHQDTKGHVTLKKAELLPTWVYRIFEDDGAHFSIIPLDDIENVETLTGYEGIQPLAQNSYDRTMEIMGPGIEKANEIFASYQYVEPPKIYPGFENTTAKTDDQKDVDTDQESDEDQKDFKNGTAEAGQEGTEEEQQAPVSTENMEPIIIQTN